MEWKKELENQFPGTLVYMAPLSSSVACHIGQQLYTEQHQKKWKWSTDRCRNHRKNQEVVVAFAASEYDENLPK